MDSLSFHSDILSRALYAEGAGIARAMPSGVIVVQNADDVRRAVVWARDRGAVLVPRGSGSGMAGGAVGTGVILDLSRLRSMHPVRDQRVWVEPGVLRDEVENAARAAGLRFPVDPSSGAFCTIGGMASTNAAGAHTLRQGSMRAWVTALDCVFEDGTHATVRRGEPPPDVPAIARFRAGPRGAILGEPAPQREHSGVRKDSSGYGIGAYARSRELIDLLVGSEGTLAIIVGVELSLVPPPGATSSLLAQFTSLEDAVDAAARAREAGASACELLDRTFLDVAAGAAAELAVGSDVETVLLAEAEGSDARAAETLARAIGAEFTAAGATRVRLALDTHSEDKLWSLRHAASPILARLDPALKSRPCIADGAVPRGVLPESGRGVRRSLAAHATRGVIFGHAGDAHVHVNPLVDVRASDWRERVAGMLDEVTSLVSRLGGTTSGEHGDGRLRTPLSRRVWPARTEAIFADVKRAFDPTGLFNQGVKVALPAQQPLEEIKYDPALPPLPAVARVALDRVERERGYARARLELITG
jgi:FAD/FMN-containing dehydrogenase